MPRSPIFTDFTCNSSSGQCEANTPTATPTATATATATATNTPVPNGGACDATSDCVSGNFCVDDTYCAEPSCPAGLSCDNPGQVGMCSEDPIAPAPALSPTSLLLALAALIALGGVGMLRRRRS